MVLALPLPNLQRGIFASKTLLPSPAIALFLHEETPRDADDSPRFDIGIVFVELPSKKHGMSGALHKMFSR